MSDDRGFHGAIPDIYDDYLVPLIFEHYAGDMAARVCAAGPGAVLETAAGSGVVARALAPMLDSSTRYTVTDLNPPMIDRARARQPADARIDWQPADALALPFADGTFDAVCCQFGVMFFPDRPKGYAEARRVLRPGGVFVFNTWDRIEENDFAFEVVAGAARVFPDDPPRFLARVPHGYHDTDAIAADLRAAGFTDFDIETVSADSAAPNPRHPAIAYCQGTPMRNEIEARDASRLEEATDSAAEAVAARFGSGPVRSRIKGYVITARA